jgi:hypothetical protein
MINLDLRRLEQQLSETQPACASGQKVGAATLTVGAVTLASLPLPVALARVLRQLLYSLNLRMNYWTLLVWVQL